MDLQYAILSDQDYERFKKDDPGFLELINETSFLESRYDCVIVDGSLLLDKALFRIPESTLKSFYNFGGIIYSFMMILIQ